MQLTYAFPWLSQEVLETGKKNLCGNGGYEQPGQLGEDRQPLLAKEPFKTTGSEEQTTDCENSAQKG
jgi:hypothetical protein